MDGDAPIPTEKLETIALDLIDESASNPRKHFDPAKLDELAADIAANGLTQPVVVRARDGGRFELVVGARRTRASKMAGRTTILAIVRELGDRATLEVQLSENANRQDVHPLEEADGYAQLIEVHHATVDEVAAKVGKPVGYVRHRLQYRALCPAGRDAFFTGKLNPHTALLVARIPVESLQVEAVKDITRPDWQGEVMGSRAAGDHIRGRYMLQLAEAPFDRGDAALVPTAGACTNCPKRTGAQPELFADVKSHDTCTDPTCFGAKKDAHWKIVAAAAKEKGQKVLSEKDAKGIFHGGRLAYSADFVDLSEKPYEFGGKKSYKGLVGKDHLPTVTVARDEHGNVHELVKKDELKRAMKSAGIAKAPSPSSNAEAEIREKKLRNRTVIDRAIAAIVPAAEARKPDLSLWMFVADALLTSGYDAVKSVEKRRGIFDEKAGSGARLKKALSTMKEPQVRALIVELIATKSSVYGNFGEDFKDACKLYGVDLKKLEAEVGAERKAAKKAKAKKSSKGKASPKGKPARSRRPAEDEGDDGDDEECDAPEIGEDLGEDETETRVWIALEVWETLGELGEAELNEPLTGGPEVGWHELDIYMSAVVPGAELLEALRATCQKNNIPMHEGEEPPAAAAPPAATDPPAAVPCGEDPAALHIPGRWVVVSLFASTWTRLRDSEKRDDVGAYMKGAPGDHQTRLYDPDGEMVAWWPDGPRPPAIVAADGDAPGVDRGVMLYLHDAAWQGLPAASQAKVQAPAAGVSVLNIRPMNATHRELGPMKASEAALVRAAAAGVGLEVFDAPPPAAAAPPLRVIIVSTAGDDWKGARKGLAAWDSKKTPGAGFTAGGSAEPLAMLYTPAADSADVSTLLSRYQKAGRLVLDLGVVPGADLEAHDPGQRAVREQWNAAHPGARVSVPEAPKAAAKKASKKGGG